MNFSFAERINPHLDRFEFDKALAIAEGELRLLPVSGYHAVLGHSLVRQAEDLVSWIDEFYKISSHQYTIRALYLEMNEFDINTDYWYIDGFAYDKDGGLNLEDMEWLVGYQTDTQTETGTIYLIDGYQTVQEAFEAGEGHQDARGWSEQIVLTRFMELVRTAHVRARELGKAWADVPVYFTEHAYDFILRSEV